MQKTLAGSALLLLPWERRQLFKTHASESFPYLCLMIWMYYSNPQSWWVASSLTRVVSLDWLCFSQSCSGSCHWQGYVDEQPIVQSFWDILQPIKRPMEARTFFFLSFPFSNYRIERNKYSCSVAASKPKGKVKCKDFSDFLVDL